MWLPDGRHDVLLHPIARAGWSGLLVTMINLLPIGQLDGGHVASAYFGDRYNVFARRLHRLMPLVAIGVFVWVYHLTRLEMGANWRLGAGLGVARDASLPWLAWFGLVLLVKRLGGGANHPPVEKKPLPRSRKALFWLMAAVFVAIFMPVPFRESITGEPPQPAAVAERGP
jgi:membrane-associated protease RseP (regulator of RpoE activity)